MHVFEAAQYVKLDNNSMASVVIFSTCYEVHITCYMLYHISCQQDWSHQTEARFIACQL